MGILTIITTGHAKAITVNFGYAKHHGGLCYLRYDDTNPSKEEQLYFDSILSSIRWLGVEPDKVTYSSDYFHRLYDLAVDLIRRDKAYICQCTGEVLNVQLLQFKLDGRCPFSSFSVTAEVMGTLRGGKGKLDTRAVCVHRNRPVQESLDLFEQMREGSQILKDMGTTLRMKQDMDDPNPQMWDLVAYRFHSAPHPRTGNEWCIYPT
jgi:glutaminyl-tRNA synthetase